MISIKMNDHYLDRASKEKEFLGQGIGFPFRLNPSGKLDLAAGEEDIRQSIKIILGTAPGERLMRPEFGCRVYELVFAPHDVAMEGLLIHYIKEALAWWEPRIEVAEVDIVENQQGVLVVEICYNIKATHDERSIVYPFYLMGEE